MTQIIDVSLQAYPQKNHNERDEFKYDVLVGLSGTPKSINSKYFYDEKGSELFNRITKHADYYLTACEVEILEQSKDKLRRLIQNRPINLIELGPGEGIKTELLIDYFLQEKVAFTYIPIDISYQYLDFITKKLEKHQPRIPMSPIHGDYFNGLKWVSLDSNLCNLVLFLGSSIGNYSLPKAQEFLCHLRENLHRGDYVLIGFDLRKDISKLTRAYNDSAGITRAFNLNLLDRMNRELGADFNLSKFNHYPVYNEVLGTMESYLVSLEAQVVTLQALNKSFDFEVSEPIHVEYSYKYLISQITTLAQGADFHIVDNYLDSRAYFVDSLWQVN